MSEKFASRPRRFIKRAALWCFWPALAVVAWGELTPNPPQDVSDLFGWDKAMHFTAYFGLALLAVLAWGRRRNPLLLWFWVVVLGGVLEGLQALTGRDAEWGDMAANMLGATLGGVLAVLLLRAALLVDRRRGD